MGAFRSRLSCVVLVSGIALGFGCPAFGYGLDCGVSLTLDVAPGAPFDTVSGKVAGVAPGDVYVVVFAQTDRWYIQPTDDVAAYLAPAADGSFETWVHPWSQVSAFVIRRGFDARSAAAVHDPLPLMIDCANVLAVAAHPTVWFSGYEWAVKAGSPLGPQDNAFDAHNVFIDGQARLHLQTAYRDGRWTCAEVYLLRPLGRGAYRFWLSSRVDVLDRVVVASPFLYDDTEHEYDIEFSRWNIESGPNAQFVVQPFDQPGHRHQWPLTLTGTDSTHIIEWIPGGVSFLSARGHAAVPSAPDVVQSFSYAFTVGETYELEPGNELVHINLWLLGHAPPSNGLPSEVIIESLVFEPPPVAFLPMAANDP